MHPRLIAGRVAGCHVCQIGLDVATSALQGAIKLATRHRIMLNASHITISDESAAAPLGRGATAVVYEGRLLNAANKTSVHSAQVQVSQVPAAAAAQQQQRGEPLLEVVTREWGLVARVRCSVFIRRASESPPRASPLTDGRRSDATPELGRQREFRRVQRPLAERA